MADPQSYKLISLVGAGVDALKVTRPRAPRHIHGGRYGDILHGWKAQAALVRARMLSEVAAARLYGRGQGLRELAASEFNAVLDPEPRSAIGTVTLRRQVTNANNSMVGNFQPGVIPLGARFRLPPDPTLLPPRAGADYQSSAPVLANANDTQYQNAGPGLYLHTQDVRVPIVASRPGPHANYPLLANPPAITVQALDTLFDPTFSVYAFDSAGGTNGVVDEQIEALARAMATAQFGPTPDAALAGALSDAGIRRAVYLDDLDAGIAQVHVADESWAGSSALNAQTLQLMLDEWIGFGCRAVVRSIVSQPIHVAATVMLRSLDDAVDASDIADAERKAIASYFDDRPNFWTWDLSALAGVASKADLSRRVLTCTSIEVRDSDGNVLDVPDPVPDSDLPLTHYWLLGDAVELTFVGPG